MGMSLGLRMLLRARTVLPISHPPVADGFVRIKGNRIKEVGKWAGLVDRQGAKDLGEVILMPGLVNAHCHLEYSDFVGAIPEPGSFTDWIKTIVDLKHDVDDTAHCQSWLRGTRQALCHGVTSLGNIENRRDLLPELWPQTPLRMVSFLELIVFHAKSDSQREIRAANDWATVNTPPRGCVGISPHAPYTTKSDLLEACAKLTDMPQAMHLGESADEDEMFHHGSGALYEMMALAGRDMSDCGKHSPMAHAACFGMLSEQLLVIHGNYLNDADIQVLANSGASLVHCPRSHQYFNHAIFRFEDLELAGVNICLGTDSLASMREKEGELELFSEMRLFRELHPDVPEGNILQMVTTKSAAALGMKGIVGEIVADAFADLTVIPFGGSQGDAERAVIDHVGVVQKVMIDGQWCYPPTSAATAYGK